METLRLGTFFWLQHPQSLFRRETNELDNHTKTKTKYHAITKQFHTPTLIYLSTPESTAIYGVPSTRNQAILEVRGGITHPHTRHPHSLAPIEQVLSRNLGGASLGWLQGNDIR